MTQGRRGTVLAVILLVLLASTALAHGAFLLALYQLQVSAAATDVLGAQAAARGAVRMGVRAMWAPELADIPVRGTWTGLTGSFGPASWEATAYRLTRELWLVHGVGRRGVAEQQTAHVAWLLDPLARVGVTPGVVASRALSGRGRVDGDPWLEVPPGWSAAECAGIRNTFLDSVFRGGRIDEWVATGAATMSPDAPLGYFDLSRLGSLLPGLTGVGTPRPTEDAAGCRSTDPWNWGDPLNPRGACGDHGVAAVGMGSITVDGGTGQGLLVVDGSLELRAGAVFYGVLVARGDVRMEGGSQIHGVLRSAGSVTAEEESAVHGSACAAMRGLTRAREPLGDAVYMPGSGWIGPLESLRTPTSVPNRTP